MTISKSDVKYVAHLAKLAIAEKDLDVYSHNLSDILALAEQMNALDTDNILPMAHPLDLSQRLRKDLVTEKNQREDFQKIAPQVEEGLYLVPQVIE